MPFVQAIKVLMESGDWVLSTFRGQASKACVQSLQLKIGHGANFQGIALLLPRGFPYPFVTAALSLSSKRQ